MGETHQLTPEQEENLVAYLDGELDEATTQEIDRALTEDAGLRQRLDTLIETWELLDCLPQAKASGEFTQKTLSTIKVESLNSPGSSAPWKQRLRGGGVLILGMLALLVSSSVGFLMTYSWLPQRSERLLKELPLIEQLDTYKEVENVEFLKKLQESRLFDEQPKTSD